MQHCVPAATVAVSQRVVDGGGGGREERRLQHLLRLPDGGGDPRVHLAVAQVLDLPPHRRHARLEDGYSVRGVVGAPRVTVDVCEEGL